MVASALLGSGTHTRVTSFYVVRTPMLSKNTYINGARFFFLEDDTTVYSATSMS